jgi:hypothetical protein
VTPLAYPVADLCVVVKIDRFPTNGGYRVFKLVTSAQREAEFFVGLPHFDLRTWVNRAVVQQQVIDRDPAALYWRLRNHDDIMSWDISTDGITFFEQYSVPGALLTDPARVVIGAGAGPEPTAVADVARFDGVGAWR